MGCVLAFGCKKSSESDARPAASSSAAAPIQSVAARPSLVPAEPPEVPTEEDFEEEASQQITSKNLEDELDKLEKELKTQ
jgi:hypothetical protein